MEESKRLEMEELKRLEIELLNKTLEEKKEIVADILCNEWYTNDDFEYIKLVLDVFYNSK